MGLLFSNGEGAPDERERERKRERKHARVSIALYISGKVSDSISSGNGRKIIYIRSVFSFDAYSNNQFVPFFAHTISF